ncbi:MAG: hypothetical protein ABW187_05390 [Dokdonella sp.]
MIGGHPIVGSVGGEHEQGQSRFDSADFNAAMFAASASRSDNDVSQYCVLRGSSR